MSKKLTTEHAVYEALRAHFKRPAYAVLPGVSNATGATKQRTVDALVMSLWPSRGLTLAAVEIKVSRSDLLRELVDPQKQEPIFKYVDHFWLAVGDESIVREGDVPPTWGLLAPGRGGSLRVVKDAPTLTPEPMPRSFLAAILRRADEQSDNPGFRAAVRAEVEGAVAAELASLRDEVRELRRERGTPEGMAEHVAIARRFFTRSGIDFRTWTEDQRDRAADIVRALDTSGLGVLVEKARRKAEWEKQDALRVASVADQRLAELAQLDWVESTASEPGSEQLPEPPQNVGGGVEVDAPCGVDRAVV